MDLIIKHDKDTTQFIALIEGKPSILNYTFLDEHTLEYYSTFVPPELRGRGIAEGIVKFALEYAKEANYKIIPSCSFVKRFIEYHPEYAMLVKK